MAFNGSDSLSFGNDFARNVVIFGVYNSLTFHTDNCENNFLVPVEERTADINDSIGTAEKKISINFTKICFEF